MPGRNIIKIYEPNQYYHVYNRGINKGLIFNCEADYARFEHLLARSLSATTAEDPRGRAYKQFRETLDLNAYCLMPNHFHMLIFQREMLGVAQFMQSICTAYSLYFNKRYERRGPLFENRFRAVEMLADSQLQHITRYIHLNHWNFKTWQHSSYRDYTDKSFAREWLRPAPILSLFDSRQQYKRFVLDHEEEHKLIGREKRHQADT